MTSIPLPFLTDAATQIAVTAMPIIAGAAVVAGGFGLILWAGLKIASRLWSWEAARNAKPAPEQ